MVRRFNIGPLNITFVLRHRFEKTNSSVDKMMLGQSFRRWELGFWFKKSRMVGKKNFGNPNRWGDNLVNNYMLGTELLWARAWVEWHIGGKVLEINVDE